MTVILVKTLMFDIKGKSTAIVMLTMKRVLVTIRRSRNCIHKTGCKSCNSGSEDGDSDISQEGLRHKYNFKC